MSKSARQRVIEAMARSWASIDGNLEAFNAERGNHVGPDDRGFTGHYEGYLSEAKELLDRTQEHNPEVGWYVSAESAFDDRLDATLQFVLEVVQVGPEGRRVIHRQVEADLRTLQHLVPMHLGFSWAKDRLAEYKTQTTVSIRTLAPGEQVQEIRDEFIKGRVK